MKILFDRGIFRTSRTKGSCASRIIKILEVSQTFGFGKRFKMKKIVGIF